MKRKKMEKEVVHLLEWIIEYPGVWQIVCNPDGKETSPESFKMAYDMLVKKSLFYLIPVLFATHPGEESLEMAKNLCTADSAAREIRKNRKLSLGGKPEICTKRRSGSRFLQLYGFWQKSRVRGKISV